MGKDALVAERLAVGLLRQGRKLQKCSKHSQGQDSRLLDECDFYTCYRNAEVLTAHKPHSSQVRLCSLEVGLYVCLQRNHPTPWTLHPTS